MADMRLKSGWALGPIWSDSGNVVQTADWRYPVMAQANSRPNVVLASILYSSNSTQTAISELVVDTITRNEIEYEGKIVTILFKDDSTGLVQGGNLVLSGTHSCLGSSNIIQLMYHNSSWYEINRSINFNDYVRVGSHIGTTVNYTAMSSITVTGRRFIECFAATGTPFTILTLRGGEAGQRVTLYAVNSEFALTVNSQGLVGGGTAGFIVTSTSGTRLNVASNATVSFNFNGTQWIEDR